MSIQSNPRLAPRGWNFAAQIPYETPETLQALRGPLTGHVTPGSGITTAPGAVYDLADEALRPWLYMKVVREGIPSEQQKLLNRRELMRLWPQLTLPKECRAVWESKFPELKSR